MAVQIEIDGAKNVRVELVAEKKEARQILRSILVNMGFSQISFSNGVRELKRNMAQRRMDLVILEAHTNDGDICGLIRDVRHARFGGNPFLPFIALTPTPTKTVVASVINSGADDLLIQPYSTGQFLERIGVLVDHRKPFVVTSDYIGPDRRSSARRGEGEEIPRIDVPNVLKARANGDLNDREMQKTIARAMHQVNLMKIDRNGHQVVWLVARIMAGFSWAADMALDEEVIGFITRLREVAIESQSRLADTPYEAVSDLCDSLAELAGRMATTLENTPKRDLDLLVELGKAFEAAFKGDGKNAALREISNLTRGSNAIH